MTIFGFHVCTAASQQAAVPKKPESKASAGQTCQDVSLQTKWKATGPWLELKTTTELQEEGAVKEHGAGVTRPRRSVQGRRNVQSHV